MEKKIGLSLILFVCFSISVNAQFYHSVGGGLVSGTGKVPAGASEGSAAPEIMGYGLFYHPRYNVTESETGAVSVGLPLTAGLSGSVNSRTGGTMSVILDLPITVDYNFGAGSSDYNESGFGGFLGLGFGYTYSNYTDEFVIPGYVDLTEQVKGSSYGPLVNGGIRAYIGDRTYFLRVFYKLGMEKAKFKTFGISAGITL
jgi:hypothetical protein